MRLAQSRLAHSQMDDPTLAEDVVQEVSLAAFRSSRRPTAGEELKHWLCRVTLRQCALAIRGRVRASKTVENAQAVSPATAPLEDPIYWLIATEDQQLVRQAMTRLDANQRQLLQLKYIEHKTYDQIATLVGGTRHAIEYQVLKARQTLRRHLNDLGLGVAEEKPAVQRAP